MTSEVTCSGCLETVPWPTGGVRTETEWLEPSGKARRVTMTDLTSDRVFHACAEECEICGNTHEHEDWAEGL